MSVLAFFGRLAIGGLGVLKWVFQQFWRIRVPAIFVVAALALAAIQFGDARHWHKVADGKDAKIAKLERDLKAEKAGRAADRKSYVDGQRAATELAKAKAARTEQIYAEKEQAHEREIETVRSDYAARQRLWMRDHTFTGPALNPDLSGAAASPGAASGPAVQTFLVGSADLDACTNAVAIAEGWQSWWSDIAKAEK